MSRRDSCAGNTIGRWLSGIGRLDESDKQFHILLLQTKIRNLKVFRSKGRRDKPTIWRGGPKHSWQGKKLNLILCQCCKRKIIHFFQIEFISPDFTMSWSLQHSLCLPHISTQALKTNFPKSTLHQEFATYYLR